MNPLETHKDGQEDRYRRHYLRRDAISFSLLAGLFIIFNFMLFKVDASIWPDGTIKSGLVILRIILIGVSVLAIYFSISTREPVVSDRWIFGWGMMLALTNNLVILTRPATYTGNIVPELMAVICLFVVMPDNKKLRIYPPVLLAAGSLVLLFTVKTLPEPVALISVLFSYLVALMMGYRISSAFFTCRRATFQAVEELAEAHRDATEGELKFRMLVQNNHGVIFVIQPDETISFVSSSWSRKLGHPVEHVVGRNYREFLCPDDIPLCEAFLKEVYATGGIQKSVCYRAIHADGTYCWYQTTIMPCYDEKGHITSFVGNGIDVSEQVQLRTELEKARHEAETASKAKSEFLALVSHEIRTPLNALVGFSSLARTTSDPEKLYQYHCILEQSSIALMELVNDILDMSKLEAGRITLESLPFSLRRMVVELDEQCRPLAEQKHLQLQVVVDPSLPDWISSDPIRIRQILANLLSNAVKFTEQGGITCTLKAAGSDAGGLPLVEITVQDSGIGIPREKLDQLFKPFHQLDPSITRRFGGTGLGLAIVDGLVRMMGGSVSINSNEGIGTTISVLLPLCPAKAPREEAAATLPLADSASILVVEDNTFNRLLLEDILTSWSHRVTTAENGEQGLLVLEEQQFDLLLLDIRMPGIDGIEFARRVRFREAHSNSPPVPIIVITADADSATREACLAAGIQDLLPKPVSPARLAEVIAVQCGIAVPPEADRHPLLTATALAGLGSNPERAHQYLDMLLQDISENLDGLQDACNGDNREELSRRAHTLKGLYAQLENSKPAELAAWLQHNAVTASGEQLHKQVLRLRNLSLWDWPETGKEVQQ
ncbi:MAG: response regulator [Geobacter sp.]|nr:response regulator [Geobacter sp.]